MSLVEEGINACKEKRFEEAIVLFDKALNENPNDSAALYQRARAFTRIGEIDKAGNDFEKLRALNPKDATIIGDHAVLLHLQEKNDEAAKSFELALDLEPDNPYRYSSRAYFKDRIGDLEGSIADYEKAIELDPEDAISYNNKGLVEEKLGHKSASIKSFDKSNDLVGYEPKLEEPKHKNTETVQESKNKPTRSQIIRSVFTQEGFKEFLNFSKSLFSTKPGKK